MSDRASGGGARAAGVVWSGNGGLPSRGAGGGGVGAGAGAVERERERERGGRRGEGEEAEDEAGGVESAGGGRVAGRGRVAAPGARAEAEAPAVAVPPVRHRLQLEQQLGHPWHELPPRARSSRAERREVAAAAGRPSAWPSPIGYGCGTARLRVRALIGNSVRWYGAASTARGGEK